MAIFLGLVAVQNMTLDGHCPKNNLNICLQTEPVTVGAEATEYVWLLSIYIWPRNQTFAIASAPIVPGSEIYRVFWGQCGTSDDLPRITYTNLL